MAASRSFAQRFVLAAGLAVAVLGGAALPAPAADVDPGMVAAHPVTGAGGPSTAAPALSAINVQAGGTEAWVTFTSSGPTTAAVSVKPMAAIASPSDPAPVAGHRPVGAGAGILAPTSGINAGPDRSTPTFETTHRLQLTNLKSNTAYEATVSAQTRDGTNLSQQVQFNTAKERVRVTVDSIDLAQDGAIYGGTDANWSLGLRWGPGPGYHPPLASGSTTSCFPHFSNEGCVYGHYDQGTFQPRNNYGQPLSWIFAQENFDFMPETFTVGAGVADDPGAISGVLNSIGNTIGATFTPGCAPDNSWQVPQGVESGSGTAHACAFDNDSGFQSTVTFRFELFYDNASYPAPQHNQPTDPWAKS